MEPRFKWEGLLGIDDSGPEDRVAAGLARPLAQPKQLATQSIRLIGTYPAHWSLWSYPSDSGYQTVPTNR
jgi:hypothetical protein